MNYFLQRYNFFYNGDLVILKRQKAESAKARKFIKFIKLIRFIKFLQHRDIETHRENSNHQISKSQNHQLKKINH